jgi:hypothetical protein
LAFNKRKGSALKSRQRMVEVVMSAKEMDALLRKIAEGDNVAFEQLYIHTKKGVYAFLRSYFNNHADTEDAM